MEKCQDVIDIMDGLASEDDWKKFEAKVLPRKLRYFFNRFEDDFYGGSRVAAPDVSLFNMIYHVERAGLRAWRNDFPEILSHFQTVSKEGLIPDYLEHERRARAQKHHRGGVFQKKNSFKLH